MWIWSLYFSFNFYEAYFYKENKKTLSSKGNYKQKSTEKYCYNILNNNNKIKNKRYIFITVIMNKN